MSILITGTPGWLGNRLASALRSGWENTFPVQTTRKITCLALPHLDAEPLKRLGVNLVRGDVRDKASMRAAFNDVETVYHVAGIIHPKKTRDLYDINATGTRNVVELAVAARVRRVVLVSSNSPAGHNTGWGRPMTEADPDRPYKSYGRSKQQAEQFLKQRVAEGKIEGVVLRPCWFYGPGQPDRQTRFFRMIRKGSPILFGDGSSQRSMSYLDNLIQGIVLADKVKEANGQTYWIADERPYKILEVYQAIADHLDVKLKPRFIPALASTMCELVDTTLQAAGLYSTDFHVAGEMAKDISCSIDKAKRELGYRPEVELREGMARSLDWCRKAGIEI